MNSEILDLEELSYIDNLKENISKNFKNSKIKSNDNIETFCAEYLYNNFKEIKLTLKETINYIKKKYPNTPDKIIEKIFIDIVSEYNLSINIKNIYYNIDKYYNEDATYDNDFITIENIQQVVAKYYNLNIDDLISTSRLRKLVRPRQIAMYIARDITSYSLIEVGKKFGRRDHTTVMHAVESIKNLIKKNIYLKEDIEIIKSYIKK